MRVNHREIVETISRDLNYFKLHFVQAGFIRSSKANNILSTLGISSLDKAGQLFHSFQTILETSQSDMKCGHFRKFVEMLEKEASMEELGKRIWHCYGIQRE